MSTKTPVTSQVACCAPDHALILSACNYRRCPPPENDLNCYGFKRAFEAEADKFPDLTLSILYFAEDAIPTDRPFRKPNHQIMLWQYYGHFDGSDASMEQLLRNMQASNLERFGLRGCKFSCYALLEGEPTPQFIRMALRAGNVFTETETLRIETQAVRDFTSNLPPSVTGKPVFCSNRNRLAVWLNHVLHHLERTHPRYLPEVRIDLDPYAASLRRSTPCL